MAKSTLKIILIGDGTVGKTAIRNRFLGKGFKSNYLMTLGADFSIKRIGMTVLQIWDLAGQDSFRAIRKNYYQGASGALLVFDVLNKKSFYNMENWLHEVISNNDRMVPTVILANKVDLLETNDPAITEEEMAVVQEKLKDLLHFDFPIIKTSALTGFNIDVGFDKLITEINEESQTIEGN